MSRLSRSVSKWLLAVVLALAALTAFAAPAMAITGVDLSTYKRVGRFDLPEPTRTTPPTGNLLAQEASGVAYNWDTDTLFVVGDGGTSVTQVTKTGALVDTMTLPPGGSDQGTEFYDTEGITYIGNNEFVMTEERYRQAVKFTYEPGGTLTRAEAKTVKLGTTIGNVGLEGLTNDPVTGGYIFAKEMEPRGVFQTQIDWNAGTATNGGPSVVNSTDLFDPALTGLIDISDVYALANVATLTGPQTNNLLIISQESGKVVNVDRSGNVASSLTLVNDPGNPLSIQQQTHEGVAMDENGVLYTVNESGGGDADHPQLWVFAPTGAPNAAPTAVALSNQTTSLPENTNTAARLKLADVVVTDDGIGTNTYSLTGPDASFFEVESSGLYLKAGTVLNKAAKASYEVTVKVEDATVSGSTPVTTSPYTLTVTSAAASTETTLAVTEVAPWGSGDGAYGADWFELTNTGTKTVNLTGWRMDDESASFGAAVTLNGVTTLAPGEAAIFTEDDPSTVTNDFKNHWFGGSPPAGFKIGSYTDTGTGLSTGGDQVNIFNPAGTRVTGVAFGSSTPRRSFDNTAALGSATSPVPVISTLSSAGTNGAVTVGGETGSPGTALVKPPVFVSEVASWGSGNPEYGADWFELTNRSSQTLDLTGWKIDDDSNSFAAGSALTGITSLAPGESAVFIEGDASKQAAFKTSWFGSSVPAALQFGSYSGPGLGTGGDQVNIFNDAGNRLTGVSFGSATTNVSFDNAAGLGSFTSAAAVSTLSAEGVNGAFKIHDQIGSPGAISGPVVPPLPSVKVTEVSSTSSSNSTYAADFWELTNTGSTTVDLTGWKVDDDSNAFGSALALSGVTSLAAGESAIFVEGSATTANSFKTAWFGSSVPAGFKIGTYSGSGIGFGSGGDQVNVFNSAGTKVTGVRFGSGTTGVSFDNAAGIGGTESPPPLISTLSVKGTNGAFNSVTGGETGSPGTIKNAPPVLPNVKVTEVSSTSSSNSTYKADFWELTNTGSTTVDLTGWKVDDDSNSFAAAIALNGVTSLAAGESAIFIEGSGSTADAFKAHWFGSSVPAGFKIGTYSGSGIGFGSGGDQVNVFNSAGSKVTGVRFGSATTGVSFDNAAGIGSATETPPPLISTLSSVGVNGAFAAGGEVGSPGTIVQPAPVAPVNTTLPSLSGAGVVGQPLTCAPGSWSGTPAPSFTYTWLRNGQIIAGAGLSTYTPVTADLGKPIRCRVTATNTAAAVNAPSNTIQISVLRCTGADISGAGSSLQGLAHASVWAPAFAAGVCNGGTTPEVSYDPVGSAAGMAAWNHDGVSGSIDTSLSFIGTDEAPTAAQIANIESAAGGAKVAVIPVAQTAIAVLANPPAGCTVEAITNSNLAGVMEGRIANWSKVDGAEGSCNAPITRVVRAEDSGTTAQFKNYLQRLYAKGLACTTGSTEGKASWAQLANTAWPESCPEKALSPVVRPAGNGGAALVDTVNATTGSISYAALPDAAAGKEGSTVLLALQNNGQKAASEASFAEPALGDVANCVAIGYQVPQLKGSLGIDWSGVFGAKPAIGGDRYPLCALTYALAFSDYSAAGFTEAQQITTYDYLAGYLLQPAGQAAITGDFYAPLPSAAEPLFDVLGASRKAAANIAY